MCIAHNVVGVLWDLRGRKMGFHSLRHLYGYINANDIGRKAGGDEERYASR